MLFYSLDFILFYLAVFLAYRLMPGPGKKPLLLAASLWFYAAWDWRFMTLLAIKTLPAGVA